MCGTPNPVFWLNVILPSQRHRGFVESPVLLSFQLKDEHLHKTMNTKVLGGLRKPCCPSHIHLIRYFNLSSGLPSLWNQAGKQGQKQWHRLLFWQIQVILFPALGYSTAWQMQFLSHYLSDIQMQKFTRELNSCTPVRDNREKSYEVWSVSLKLSHYYQYIFSKNT